MGSRAPNWSSLSTFSINFGLINQKEEFQGKMIFFFFFLVPIEGIPSFWAFRWKPPKGKRKMEQAIWKWCRIALCCCRHIGACALRTSRHNQAGHRGRVSVRGHTCRSYKHVQLSSLEGLILVAFVTGNSSLEPLIEGLYAQIHVNLR